MDKYAVFLDVGYFVHVLKEFRNPKVDYLKLSEFFASGDQRLRTYYYNCSPYIGSPPSTEERQRKRKFDSFVYNIKRLPRFEVRLGKLKRYLEQGETKFEQKMVDILLAIDLVKLSVEKSIQRAVLITNDTDFVPAIKVAKDAGVIVDLYRGQSGRNDALIEACDTCTYIDKDLIKEVKL